MRRSLVAVGLAGLLLASSWGCGGKKAEEKKAAPESANNEMRIVRPGDVWDYEVVGYASFEGVTTELAGTAKTQVLSAREPSPVVKEQALQEYTLINVRTAPGVSPERFNIQKMLYFTQDQNGTVNVSGGSHFSVRESKWVRLPAAGKFRWIPSPVVAGQTGSELVTFADNTTMSFSYSVEGVEEVALAVGRLPAYKIASSASTTDQDGYHVLQNEVLWVIPKLGIVRRSTDTYIYDGSGNLNYATKLMFVLSDTNVIDLRKVASRRRG